ncbi:uncharacterized protein LOC143153670 [Ptiloglossa arizonensis]|uniref:uncharacterized protein LOC143153670 n=1 Tax=Ptiloglossa arizonensis TaxID=3350558 RepID=UPI003FA16BEE
MAERSASNAICCNSGNLRTPSPVPKTSLGRFSKSLSSDRNSSPKVIDKSREISFTVISNSVVDRQESDVSKTVLKVHSRTTMKKESRNDRCLESDDSRKDASSRFESGAENPRAFEKIVETDVEPKVSDSSTESTGSFEEKKPSTNSALTTQDGTIGDVFLGCPLELVEIYPGNKEQSQLGFNERQFDESREVISTKLFAKENDPLSKSSILEEDDLSSKSSSTKEEVFLFAEVRSKKGEKVCPVDPNGEESTQGNDRDYEESFREISSATAKKALSQPIRDSRKLDDRKIENDLEGRIRRSKDESTSEAFESITKQFEMEKKSNPSSIPKERSHLKLEDEKIGSEMFQDSGVKASSRLEYRFSAMNDTETSVSRRYKMNSDEKRSLNREKSANAVHEKTRTIEEEDRNVASSSSLKSNGSMTSIGTESSRSFPDDRSSVYDRSETDSSTMESTVIDLRERSPSHGGRNLITDEKCAKIITEKREIEENEIDVAAIVGNIVSREEIDRTSMIDDLEMENDRDTVKKIERLSIEDFKLGMINLKTKRSNVNANVKICELLTRIYDNLLCDWQIMESIRIKHRGDVSVDSICSKMTLLLLNRTIERCKDYIYCSDDSYKAELEITELFSKDVIQLVKAVNWNKRVIEEHDRRLDRIQPELHREENANRKRRIFNETVAFWDQWTREISRLIGSIFALIKDVAVNNEEKENVQNSRQYKSTNGRATSFLNDRKGKHGIVGPKIADINLPVTRESSDETQMSAILNTNTSVKRSRSRNSMKITPRSREKERPLEVPRNKTIEKKTIDTGIRHREDGRLAWKSTLNTDTNRSKQPTSRQKHRASANPHPVWRPGGSVKLPTSSSATILTQKSRPFLHAKEKTNQTLENTKWSILTKFTSFIVIIVFVIFRETKQGRTTSESKKRVSHEMYSTSRHLVPTLAINGFKITSKRSNLSLKTSPRLESRPGTIRIGSKGKPLRHSESACTKNCEKTSSSESFRRKSPKESKVLRVLEEIVKSTPMEKRGNKGANKRIARTTAIKEDTKIHEEEPTRDIDASKITRSPIKHCEQTFRESRRLMGKPPRNPRLMEKLPENPRLMEELSENPRLMEELSENPRLMEKLSKNPRLMEKLPENPRLMEELPKNPRLMEKLPENPRLMEELPKNPRLMEKLPENPRLMEELSENPRLMEKFTENPRLMEKFPENSQLVGKFLENTRVVEKLPENSRLIEKLPENSQLMEKHLENTRLVEKLPEKSRLVGKLPENARLVERLPENRRLIEKLTENSQLMENSRLVENPSKKFRLVENPSENTRLVENPSEKARLVERLPENRRLIKKLPENSRLVENRSEKFRLVENTSEKFLLVENPSIKFRLVENPSENTRLVENPSEKARLVERLPENRRLIEKVPENSRLMENRSEKFRLVENTSEKFLLAENPSKKFRLVENPSENTRLVENPSEKARSVERLPENRRLIEKLPENSRLVENRSEKFRLVENTSEKFLLAENPSKKFRLVENPSENTRLVENPSENTRLVENPLGKARLVEKPVQRPVTHDCVPFTGIGIKEDVMNTEVDVNLGSSQPNDRASYVSMTSTSCKTEFSESSGSIAGIESSDFCQTSSNSVSSSCASYTESKDERSRKRDHLQVSFADRVEERRSYDWTTRNENSNDPTIGEHKSKNHSVTGNEKSDRPLVGRKENSNNPTIREEKSRIPSIIRIKKFHDPLVVTKENSHVSRRVDESKNPSITRKEKSNSFTYVRKENFKHPTVGEEKSKNPSITRKEKSNSFTYVRKENFKHPTVGEEKSKNPSITRKEKSNSFTYVRKENFNHSTVGEEKSKNPLIVKEKKFVSSFVKERKTEANVRPPLMNMLKEFLCNQGIDIELVNKAERCLREKQKICRCLKKKSASFDDVSSSVRGSQRSETTLKRYRELEQVFESNEDAIDCGDRLKIDKTVNCLLRSSPEKRDIATCTECPSSSRIAFQTQTTKSLETNLEEMASIKLNVQTQTETDSNERITSEYRDKASETVENSKSRNVSSMTDTLLTDNRFTETVQDSKSVATEHVHCSNFDEKLQDSRKNSTDSISIEALNEQCREIRNNDRDSTKNRESDRSGPIQCPDESSKNFEQIGEPNSMSFTSLDLTSKCLEDSNRKETTNEESTILPVKVISSRTIAAIHLATIRARNVYMAIDIYKQSLKDKLKTLENRTKHDETRNTVIREDSSSSLYESKDVDIIVTKSMDSLDSDDEVEVSETTKRMDVAKSKESIDGSSKLESVVSGSVSTSSVSFVESIFREIDSKSPVKSSSSVTTKDTRSLMEFLIRETERATDEGIYRVEKVTHDTYTRCTTSKEESENKENNEFSMFSRESLLPLVYGIVCCIVFWCLQFTITCDVVA